MFKTSNCANFINYCENAPEVIDLYRVSGESNYLLKVMTDSMDSLALLLDSLMKFGLLHPIIVIKVILRRTSRFDLLRTINPLYMMAVNIEYTNTRYLIRSLYYLPIYLKFT